MLLASDVLGCYALALDAAGEAVEAGVTPCGAVSCTWGLPSTLHLSSVY